jgi:hypothetical protein
MACTNLLYNAFVIYDEHASQADTLVLDQYPVVSTQAMGRITKQRDVNPSEATILPGNVLPMPQRVLSVDGDKDNATVAILELIQAVLKC